MTKTAIRQCPSWRLQIALVFGVVGAIAFMGESSLAQITPDATLGAENSIITPNANIGGFPADLIQGGASRGTNLFHSFQEFNVGTGQRVYFANPAGIENILTRVTGNNLSNILGTLGVTGGADLFLLNPNGIIFGPNARLDVGGSFFATTANAIQFGDQGFFSATNPEAPPLLTINPSALWFNQVQSGRIVNNSIAPAGTSPFGIPLFGLRVPDGQSLLLVGGDIEMDRGSLNAPGGRIELGGLAEAGAIALEKTGNTFKLGFPSQSRRSNVTLANDARVSVRGSGGGDIVVNADLLSAANGGRLVAGTEGAGNGGDITVNATQVTLTGIGQSGLGAGFYNQKIENGIVTSNAGNITVNTESLSALAGAAIFNDVLSGVGNGGDIIINTGSLSLTEAELSASSFGQGDAANIIINARDTVSFNGGVVYSTLKAGAVGSSGDIVINAGSLSLTNGAQLIADTQGQGDAGNIIINVRDTVSFDGENSQGNRSGIFNQVARGAVGQGGDINLTTNSLLLTNGAQLSAGTFGQGDAGSVTINARESVSFDGENSQGFNSGVFNQVARGAVGQGGDINLTTGSLSLTNGAQLSAGTLGQGDAGSVTINARESVSFDGEDNQGFNSGVFNQVARGAVGQGGDINLTTNSLLLTNGAQLSAGTFGQGNAGSVTINARESVSFDGEDSQGFNSGVFNQIARGAVGQGGDINLTTGSLSLTNGAQLSASTFGQGDAGSVTINARESVSFDGENSQGFNSGVFNQVARGAVGQGGDINLTTGSLSLTNGAQLSAGTLGQGDAGSVTINARESVSFDGEDNQGFNSGVFNQVAQGAVGQGGDINLTTGSLSLTNGAQLSASTLGQGDAGSVTINARESVSVNGKDSQGGSSGISNIVSATAEGNGGDIIITTGSLSVTDGSQLATPTFGRGDAGDIRITARDTVSFAGSVTGVVSGVDSEVEGRGGDITIDTGSLFVTDKAGLFTNSAGRGDAGNIQITARDTVSFARGGIAESNLEATGVGRGGDIGITTGVLSVTDKARVGTSTRGQGDAGDIRITADETISVTNGARLLAFTAGQGDAGDVIVTARNSVSFDEDSEGSSSGAFSTVEVGAIGKGGNVNVTTGSLSVTNGAQLAAGTFGRGDAGSVNILAHDTVSFEGVGSNGFASGAFSLVSSTAMGNGGNVNVTTGSLVLTNGAQLNTSTFGQGDAGNISVRTIDSVTLSNTSFFTSAVGYGGVGNGGNIDIQTRSLSLTNGTFLFARTDGQGNAGNIVVKANDSVSLANSSYITSSVGPGGIGNGGDVDIETRSLFATNGSQVQSAIFREYGNLPGGRGRGGNVRVNASDSITLSGVSQDGFSSGFLTLTERGASGQAGDITVNTGALRIADGAAVSAQTFNPSDGGNITINTNTLEAVNGGQVLTTTRNGGRAGNITINATDSITLSGSDPNFADRLTRFSGDEVISEGAASGVFASTRPNSRGNGGTITLRTNNLSLSDRAQIASSSQGTGDAGRVEITANEAVTLTNSDITTSAEQASGGAIAITTESLSLNRGRITAATGTSGAQGAANITLQGLDLLLMGNESLISANALNQANGGNVAIDSTFIVATPPTGLRGSDITANAFEGNGGRVSINTQGLFGIEFRPELTPENDITVSSTFGLSGEFALDSPGIDPSRGLAQLSTNLIDAAQQIDRRCTPGGEATNSSFIITGRGGLPPSPNDVLQGETVVTPWVSLDAEVENNISPVPTTPTSSVPRKLVEAQGWVINDKGEVVLTASAPTLTPTQSGFSRLECLASQK